MTLTKTATSTRCIYVCGNVDGGGDGYGGDHDNDGDGDDNNGNDDNWRDLSPFPSRHYYSTTFLIEYEKMQRRKDTRRMVDLIYRKQMPLAFGHCPPFKDHAFTEKTQIS